MDLVYGKTSGAWIAEEDSTDISDEDGTGEHNAERTLVEVVVAVVVADLDASAEEIGEVGGG